MMKEFIKSIFAGVCIGFAGCLYMQIEPRWVGAILFSIGLCIICLEEYNLYTGKVGYINNKQDCINTILYLIGNICGTFLVSCVTSCDTSQMIITKLSYPIYLTFFKAFCCGFLMYIAVDIFKKFKSIIGPVCGVTLFIICGFEHCIADMYYIFESGIFNWNIIIFLVVVILGNAVGALSHKLIHKCQDE